MNEDFVAISTPQEGVTSIALNRPAKRNAMNPQLIHDLNQALKKISTDAQTRLLLIEGKGEHFCAGADLKWMQTISQGTLKDNRMDATELAHVLNILYTFPKPVIGLVHGMTMGGGLGLIACCDIVIAAENAQFCFSETKIGLTPSVISPYVIAAIGERAARYYFLTAKKFTAFDAQRMGLVHEVVSNNHFAERSHEFLKELLSNSPHALLEAKKLISHVSSQHLSSELIEYTAAHLATMRVSRDAQEGLKAFLEKRSPVWEVPNHRVHES